MLEGHEHSLIIPHPFCNVVTEARVSVNAKAHEEFFRTWLADMVEPGRPFGLSEVRRRRQRDHGGTADAAAGCAGARPGAAA